MRTGKIKIKFKQNQQFYILNTKKGALYVLINIFKYSNSQSSTSY